jgi:phage gp36-like protein
MSYATKYDMLRKFGPQELQQLTDIDKPRLNAINEAVLDGALSDASAWIDGYLVGRYEVPIVDEGALRLLQVHACNVARYQLMSTRADEQALAMFKAAEKYFISVSRGEINLIATADVPQPAGMGNVEFNSGSKHFGREA